MKPLPEMWLDADAAAAELVITSNAGDLLRMPLHALPPGEQLRYACTRLSDPDDPTDSPSGPRYFAITVREIPGPGTPNAADLPVYWCFQIRDPHPPHKWVLPRPDGPDTYYCEGQPGHSYTGHSNGCQGHPSRDERAMPGSLYYCDGACADREAPAPAPDVPDYWAVPPAPQRDRVARVRISDFPFPVGSFVRSGINCRFQVQDHDGWVYLQRAPKDGSPGGYGQYPPAGAVFTASE